MGGANSSATHCINLEFLQEGRKDDFLQTLGQCSEKDKKPIRKEILREGGQIRNFVLMTKGAPAIPKLWHSENMFVCAITTPNPPIKEWECASCQYHSQAFMSIHLDPCSHYHMIYFMNRVRFYLEQQEFLECILKLQESRDPEIHERTCRPRDPPETKMPVLKIAVPYSIVVGGEGELPIHYSTIIEREIDETSSLVPPVSEPDSMFGSSSMAPPLSEPTSVVNGSSSFIAGLSEPSSVDREGQTTSSFFVPVTEPSEASSSLTSFFDAISEPSSAMSISSILDPVSEPHDMLSGRGWDGGSSIFGIVSEASLSGNSGLSSQFGIVSEVSGEGNSGMSSIFGLVSEPSGINSGTALYSSESD